MKRADAAEAQVSVKFWDTGRCEGVEGYLQPLETVLQPLLPGNSGHLTLQCLLTDPEHGSYMRPLF